MLDHTLEKAFCIALQAAPPLSNLYFFTGQTEESRELPALTVISKSEALAGSPAVFRAEVQIVLESHAHDAPSGLHITILGYLREVLADKPLLIAAANATGNVHLFGYSLSTCEPEAADGKFRTVMTMKAGYRAPAN